MLPSSRYSAAMSKILDEAMDAVRALPATEQADIAHEMRDRALQAQGFTRATGGYELRVPSAWMLGRSARYLATDAQVEAISEARNTNSDTAMAVAASAVAVAVVYVLPAAWLPSDFFAGQTVGHVCFWIGQSGLTFLACAQAYRWLAFRRLQPVVAGLSPSVSTSTK